MAIKDLMQFLYEVKGEMKRVVWPKFDEFVGSTIIVLVLVAIFMVYIGGIDAVLAKLRDFIIARYGNF